MTLLRSRHPFAPCAAVLALLAALGCLLSSSSGVAEVRTEPLEYVLDGVTFKGVVAWDDAGEGRRPGVLVVPEWWGCNEYAVRRARDLAAMGYVALACDMYGEGRVTGDPSQAAAWAGEIYGDRALLRRRASEALGALSRRGEADPSKLAAIGFCFGGTVVLELARSGAELASVASFHGGLGTPLPAEPGAVKAEVLVLNGAEDPMVSADERQSFMDEMRRAGARWTFAEFGGAVHSFSNPGAGAVGIPGVAHDARAERQSWGMLTELLRRTLGR